MFLRIFNRAMRERKDYNHLVVFTGFSYHLKSTLKITLITQIIQLAKTSV